MLLRQSDFVSIHCVLNDETKHLLGARELATMKSTAYLINVSRGRDRGRSGISSRRWNDNKSPAPVSMCIRKNRWP